MNPTKKPCKSSKVGLSHQLVIIHIVLSSILLFTITWQNNFYNKIFCVSSLHPLLFYQNNNNNKNKKSHK